MPFTLRRSLLALSLMLLLTTSAAAADFTVYDADGSVAGSLRASSASTYQVLDAGGRAVGRASGTSTRWNAYIGSARIGYARPRGSSAWNLYLGSRSVATLELRSNRWELREGSVRSGWVEGDQGGPAGAGALLLLLYTAQGGEVYQGSRQVGTVTRRDASNYEVSDASGSSAGSVLRSSASRWYVNAAGEGRIGGARRISSTRWSMLLGARTVGRVSQSNGRWNVTMGSRKVGWVNAGSGPAAAGAALLLLVYPQRGGDVIQGSRRVGAVTYRDAGHYDVDNANGGQVGSVSESSSSRWMVSSSTGNPLGEVQRSSASRWSIASRGRTLGYVSRSGARWNVYSEGRRIGFVRAGPEAGAGAAGAALILLLGSA